METAAQFDLNKAICNWRETLAGSPAMGAGDLDELETHLRDSIFTLEGKGLSAHEAFWVARSRMGDASALTAEYQKIHIEQVWQNRLLWMLAGALFFGLIFSLIGNLARAAVAGLYALTEDSSLLGAWNFALVLAAFTSIALLLWKSGRNQNGLVWRATRFVNSRPKTTVMMVILFPLFTQALNIGVHMLSGRVMTPSVYGQFLAGYATLVLLPSLFVPLAFSFLLLRRKKFIMQ
jgi:hypothetical protein